MIEIDLKTSVSEIKDVITLQKIPFIPAYNDIAQSKAPVDAISYFRPKILFPFTPIKAALKLRYIKVFTVSVSLFKECTNSFDKSLS